jgi:SHS2 domain-containing protein
MVSESGYKLIDHPSDMGIEVEGDTLVKLFENAARGMLTLISDARHDGEKLIRKLHIKEDTVEELLHSFLNEILWLIEDERFFPVKTKVDVINSNEINVELKGVIMGDNKIDREVKAVTYHQLKVENVGGKLFTRIIFDV